MSEQPLSSAWNTTQYTLDGVPITNQAVKSAFELPFGATLKAGRQHVLTGRSWSGHAPIKRVEVSTGGRYEPAQLVRPNLPNAWVRWRHVFRPRTPGAVELRARATDWHNNTQPDTVPLNPNGYLFWGVVKHPITVTV